MPFSISSISDGVSSKIRPSSGFPVLFVQIVPQKSSRPSKVMLEGIPPVELNVRRSCLPLNSAKPAESATHKASEVELAAETADGSSACGGAADPTTENAASTPIASKLRGQLLLFKNPPIQIVL